MFMYQKEWDEKHIKYKSAEWIDKPAIFAKWVVSFLPKSGRLLDMGCGQGQDSRFFSELGYEVMAVDLSAQGIRFAEEKANRGKYNNLEFKTADIVESLPFADSEFDVVYSHLAIHYFDTETTFKIITEIKRVLKPGGVFACLVNSIHDPEYSSGEQIETDYFLIHGIRKHFFSKKTLGQFLSGFETVVLDENGETYKDRAINTQNLVRFVGRNIS